ncbi:MAG: sulfite exporter TauE/SafE family protein [Clostridia bacterium]|nr:sulfite exporter TauE/SafE family protein [Clostridia bacterium]
MLDVLIGFISGIISGMGIGGGAILIPALVLLRSVPQQTAQGINLVYFIPTAICALIVHIKNKNVEIKSALIMGGTGAIGAVLGSYIARGMEDGILRKFFGVFLLFIGIYVICQNFVKKKPPIS